MKAYFHFQENKIIYVTCMRFMWTCQLFTANAIDLFILKKKIILLFNENHS